MPGTRHCRDDLETLLRQWESREMLHSSGFAMRMAALDRLEILLDSEGCPELMQQASELRSRLEEANAALLASLRQAIRSGDGSAALSPWFLPGREANPEIAPGLGFDWRDDLVAGILELPEPEPPPSRPGGDMVFYQPTPARHIFDLLRQLHLQPHDTLIDLGSGLGHVPLLAAIATPERCLGIELEKAYVACVRECAADLGLINVTFVEGDVREVDLSAGSVFYLYTPFTGALLKSVLDRLRIEALLRPIAIGTFGPCTGIVANEGWLEPDGVALPDRIAVFRSRLKRA